MFGYVLPLRGELKVRELESYQGLYCGLCHTLGSRYGFFSRWLLNYDFTFLAMILAPASDQPELQKRRCIACPLRGKRVCTRRESLDLAADESLVLAYWKLQDAVADSSFWRGLPARFLSLFFHPAYQKAATRCPEFVRETTACLEELRVLEADHAFSMDRAADTFARILCAASPAAGDSVRDRAVAQLLYHVGRWIYLVDAWDDLEDDRKRKGYNPYLARFPDGPERHTDEIRTTLRHSLNLAVSACNLTDFGPWNGLVLNILCLGLPTVEEAVFTGQCRQLKKQTGRNRHERSL